MSEDAVLRYLYERVVEMKNASYVEYKADWLLARFQRPSICHGEATCNSAHTIWSWGAARLCPRLLQGQHVLLGLHGMGWAALPMSMLAQHPPRRLRAGRAAELLNAWQGHW